MRGRTAGVRAGVEGGSGQVAGRVAGVWTGVSRAAARGICNRGHLRLQPVGPVVGNPIERRWGISCFPLIYVHFQSCQLCDGGEAVGGLAGIRGDVAPASEGGSGYIEGDSADNAFTSFDSSAAGGFFLFRSFPLISSHGSFAAVVGRSVVWQRFGVRHLFQGGEKWPPRGGNGLSGLSPTETIDGASPEGFFSQGAFTCHFKAGFRA